VCVTVVTNKPTCTTDDTRISRRDVRLIVIGANVPMYLLLIILTAAGIILVIYSKILLYVYAKLYSLQTFRDYNIIAWFRFKIVVRTAAMFV